MATSMIYQADPLMPLWLAIVLTALVVIVVCWHVHTLLRSRMPPSRRRIREANAAVTLVLAPLLGMSFGVVHPGVPAAWLACWSASVAMLGLTVVLAVIDSINNLRLHRVERRALMQEIAASRAPFDPRVPLAGPLGRDGATKPSPRE